MRSLGSYILFLKELIVRRERFKTYIKLFIDECIKIGNDSVFIISIVSIFTGGVLTLQTAYNLTEPYIKDYVVSLVVRDTTILEMAPTAMALVFTGKVGSQIASELGNMRISEQIDAIEVMGINATSFLVLPKILATTAVYPLLVIIACFLSIFGGYLTGVYSNIVSSADFIYGLRAEFRGFSVVFAIIKAFVFGFLISSISSYIGYHTKGGALEVGEAGTKAVTNSCIAILISDYILSQVLLISY